MRVSATAVEPLPNTASAAVQRAASVLCGLYAILTPAFAAASTGWLMCGVLSGVLATLLEPRTRRSWRIACPALMTAALGLGAYAAGTVPGEAPWRVPVTWQDLLTLSPAGAVLASACLLGGLRLLVRQPEAPSPRALLGLCGLPYAFNALLALASPVLVTELGRRAFSILHLPTPALDSAGRWLALTLLTGGLVLILGWLLDGRGLRAARTWAIIVATTTAAAAAPWWAALGSSSMLATAPVLIGAAGALLTASLAQAGLWAMTFLATGVVIDALHRRLPTALALTIHARKGALAGARFGALFMLFAAVLALAVRSEGLRSLLASAPILSGALGGSLLFALAHTAIESSDTSSRFFARLLAHLRNPNEIARGVVAGVGLAVLAGADITHAASLTRAALGAAVGALAYAGVDLARNALSIALRRRQRLESLALYLCKALLGGFIGGALAWYFDAAQFAEVSTRLLRFGVINFAEGGDAANQMVIYPLFSKWGAIDLGTIAGGTQLFYAQSLAGVINWALAAPLFGFNLCLLNALLSGSRLPLRRLLTREGAIEVIEQTVRVLRWGLWMAPIIFAFLKVAAVPAWYNQDGLIRTILAIGHALTLSPPAFADWSREMFLGLLAYDWLRVVIWVDHMGFRVATLVNLSFVGLDRLERVLGRWLGYGPGARMMPEGIRRFCTWAPLLIPFYLPRGGDWDYVWSGAERVRNAGGALLSPVSELLLAYGVVVLLGSVSLCFALRTRRSGVPDAPATPPLPATMTLLGNGLMRLQIDAEGNGYLSVRRPTGDGAEIDLTRRATSATDPRGPWFYLSEASTGRMRRLDSFTLTRPAPDRLELRWHEDDLEILISASMTAECALLTWTFELTNLSATERCVTLTSYREIALNVPGLYLRQPSFNQLHVRTEFEPNSGAMLANNRLLHDARGRSTPEVALHAVVVEPLAGRLVGYEDSRPHFMAGIASGTPAGRAVSDVGTLYTFDPITALGVELTLPADGKRRLRFYDGYFADRPSALATIGKPLAGSPNAPSAVPARTLAPLPAGEFRFDPQANEYTVSIHTPRPWTHMLANESGFGAIFSNLGDHCSFALNAQQNMLTPFTCDTVASPAPGRAFYVCELDIGRIDSATYAPCRHADTDYRTRLGLGYVVNSARSAGVDIEVTSFVPPDAPLELALITIRNPASITRRFRFVSYAELLLAEIRGDSHALLEYSNEGDTLLVRNRHNGFAKGWAFVAVSFAHDGWEAVRNRFLGTSGDVARPAFVAEGRGDHDVVDDGTRIAACATAFELAAGATVQFSVVLGFAAERASIAALVASHVPVAATTAALSHTCSAWQARLGQLRIKTSDAGFDRLVNDWLPYQVLTSRLWGRMGPNQRSGAYGYRDQLQDVLPFALLDPALTRRQILLHAEQQFGVGDVLKWWHPARAGKTSFWARTRASDPQLWLPYIAFAYVHATGDRGILDEPVPFLAGPPVPRGQEGYGFVPRRSRESASLYEHCRRSIEYTLERLGAHGLPLIGTGDWNDGIDRLGEKERGESGWLGCFLSSILRDFTMLAEARGEAADQHRWSAARESLNAAIASTWTKSGYLRATDDAGRALETTDALMGAWPLLSGAVPIADGERALSAALKALEQDRLVQMLTPAFDEHTLPYPGRIADYPPGVRENGGQYSHGVSWLVDAAVLLVNHHLATGDAAAAAHWQDTALRLWRKISPLDREEPEMMSEYGLPPYQQAADIYFGAGYAGRGGWAGYTGAAARMLWAAYAVLGLEIEGGEVRVVPRPAVRGLRVEELRYRGQAVAGVEADTRGD